MIFKFTIPQKQNGGCLTRQMVAPGLSTSPKYSFCDPDYFFAPYVLTSVTNMSHYRCFFMIIPPSRKNNAANRAQTKMLSGEIMPINSIITAKTSIMMPRVFIFISPLLLPIITIVYLCFFHNDVSLLIILWPHSTDRAPKNK